MKRAVNGDVVSTGRFNGVIHYTGSHANQFTCNNFSIDWGSKISYTKGVKVLKGVKHIFITHGHLDHVNPSATVKYLTTHPFVKMYVPKHVKDTHFNDVPETINKRIIIVKHGDTIDIGDNFVVHVVRGSHSVPVLGYIVEDTQENNLLLYSTDNYNFSPLERMLITLNKPVICMLLEGNYDENLLTKAIEQTERELSKAKLPAKRRAQINAQMARLDGSAAHASVQQCKKFYRKNRISKKETTLYIMHASDIMFDM